MPFSFDRFLTRLGSRFLLAFFGLGPKVYGKERIPRDNSPLIILSNWAGTPDPAVLLSAFPIPLAFFAPAEIKERPLLGFLSKGQGNIHLRNLNYGPDAFRAARGAINSKANVVFLFENPVLKTLENETRTRFAARFAHRAKARVLPVYIEGTDKALPFGSWVPKIENIRVLIGEPEEIPFQNQKNIRKKEVAYMSQYFALKLRALETILLATPPGKSPAFPVEPPSPEQEKVIIPAGN